MFVLDSQIASEELDNGVVRKIKGYIERSHARRAVPGRRGRRAFCTIIRTVSAIMW